MATTNENQLIELEKQYWQALKDDDMETCLRLTDDPCLVTGPQGVGNIDKKTFREMMKTSQWKLHEFDLKDVQVRMLSDDVAVLAYKVHEKMTVDGKPLTLDAADASTWVRRKGKWVCALHSEAITGDPFGRDRTAARSA